MIIVVMRMFTKFRRKSLTARQIAKAKQIYLDRNCAYCGWLRPVLSWWCTNEEIIEMRGTKIPGIWHCPGWKPDKKYIIKKIKED